MTFVISKYVRKNGIANDVALDFNNPKKKFFSNTMHSLLNHLCSVYGGLI